MARIVKRAALTRCFCEAPNWLTKCGHLKNIAWQFCKITILFANRFGHPTKYCLVTLLDGNSVYRQTWPSQKYCWVILQKCNLLTPNLGRPKNIMLFEHLVDGSVAYCKCDHRKNMAWSLVRCQLCLPPNSAIPRILFGDGVGWRIRLLSNLAMTNLV